MSKASIIRQIVAAGYTAKSPNTLRRWNLDALQALLDSLTPIPAPCEPHVVSEDMQSYVEASIDLPSLPAPVSVPCDRELYVLALRHPVDAPNAMPVQSSASRWIDLALSPWAFLLQVCGIA